MTIEARFWSKVDVRGPLPTHCPNMGECWLWTGAKSDNGYGRLMDEEGRIALAHRVAWRLAYRRPPTPGLDLCHHCDNRACVNPLHLFLGTRQDNVDDMMRKGRYGERRHLRGEEHPGSKLTAQQVLEVRALLRAGCSHSAIGRRLGVGRMVIRGIASGKTWSHLA